MSDVRNFGAKGDGRTDDSDAIRTALKEGDGVLFFPRGTYVITRPIEIALADCGRTSVSGAEGCATLVMKGAGPAVHFHGTHTGTAFPETFKTTVRDAERMPVVCGIEIVGAHQAAIGIELEGLWEPTLTRVHVRDCLHGIHIVRRNRNLIIGCCHVYNNRGIGIYYDRVNLHQSNIYGSHISYNRGGGIKVLESEIRNLQVSSNDIEYNFDTHSEESADVWIDTGTSSVREGTIVGNTIQAMPSRGGANVRFHGHGDTVRNKTGNWTISGNLISSQAVNIHLLYARGIVVTGNCFFSAAERTLRIEHSENIVVGANVIDRNPDYRVESGDGIEFVHAAGCSVTGMLMTGTRVTGPDAAAISVRQSQSITITGCTILDPEPCGILLKDSSHCLVSGCNIMDRCEPKRMQAALCVDGGAGNLCTGNLVEPA
ncbi:MAG: hypothetical protein A3K19_11020 [Lentisphaerae bacterium RIFOXYB12_FULL_65_16]|nr:MAG: hypothetical protein A3K18_15110 [Lentisphaerae bacterium RIFOXYA12_64_32]OGV94361.1 MAG: hypothetical protein A3K19_11020 [Lentisphaerae bacterium RIFOXYB12_FULL_65_16]